MNISDCVLITFPCSESEVWLELWESLLDDLLLGFSLPLDFLFEGGVLLLIEVLIDCLASFEGSTRFEQPFVVPFKDLHRLLESAHLVSEHGRLRTAEADEVRLFSFREIELISNFQRELLLDFSLKDLLVLEKFVEDSFLCLNSSSSG